MKKLTIHEIGRIAMIKNNVTLMGYPSRLVVDNEANLANFKLTVTESITNKDGEHQIITNVFDCAGIKPMAKIIAKSIKETCYISICGKLRNNDYEDARGYTHTYTWIQVENLINHGKNTSLT